MRMSMCVCVSVRVFVLLFPCRICLTVAPCHVHIVHIRYPENCTCASAPNDNFPLYSIYYANAIAKVLGFTIVLLKESAHLKYKTK